MRKQLLALGILTLPLQALVEKTIDEKRPIEIAFSTTSHNRISVEGGSIEKVFGDENHFQVNIDRTTGNAFIQVVREIGEKPITLTVVTNGGLIQDLAVSSKEIPSEHLILKEEEEPETLIEINTSLQSHTVDLLNAILQGKVPLGYGDQAASEGQTLNLPQPLKGVVVKTLEGPFDVVRVYKIRNTGKNPVIVTPDALKTQEMSWLFLNAHELRGHEEALCLIAFPKKEG